MAGCCHAWGSIQPLYCKGNAIPSAWPLMLGGSSGALLLVAHAGSTRVSRLAFQKMCALQQKVGKLEQEIKVCGTCLKVQPTQSLACLLHQR